MSDTEGTAPSDQEEVLEFKCRKCPGKTFTAAEKDSHREFHRQEKQGHKKKRPGPKSKTRGRNREGSPNESEVTLFQAVEAAATTRKSSRKRKPANEPAPGPKRKSTKSYDNGVIGQWQKGNGA